MKILLITYDNGSHIHTFPLGMAYIASALREAGHKVSIYSQDVYHYPESHLTEYLNKHHFDVVGMSIIGGYYQYQKLLKISKAIADCNKKPIYIIGGHGVSPEPEYFLKKTKADFIIIGEGEETIVDLLQIIGKGKALNDIKGIAYRIGDAVKVNERRPLIKNIDELPFPAYDLFPMDYYKLIRTPNCDKTDFVAEIITSRGCIFKCNFCYRMDKGIRLRSVNNIIKEIKLLKQTYGITYIDFIDELTMPSKQRMFDLCNAFIKENLNIKWRCEGRLNYADKDVLDLMKKAGCVFINYGIESMDDKVLKNMNKNLTVKQIIKGIENTKKVGISPGLNIIWGNIGDNRETLKKGINFLIKYDDGAQLRTIRPVTPYPGCELYYYAIGIGLLKDIEDFYENKHLNSDLLSINFTKLTDKEFHKCLYEANFELVDNYLKKKFISYANQMHKLYMEKDITFRGFRQT